MQPLTLITQRLRGFNILLTACCAFLCAAPMAHARTATFVAPTPITAGDAAALSLSGDGAGYFMGAGASFGLLFDEPFGLVQNEDDISIFTLAPSVGNVRLNVSFVSYNPGAPSFVRSRSVNAGNSIGVGNLFQQGCAVLGGCDYIEVTVERLQGGAAGAEIDYVDVNGEVTTVAAPTPEPGAWALMIIGFAALAWRLKAVRRNGALRTSRAPPLRPGTAGWRGA